MPSISLMVLSKGGADDTPLMLIEKDGFWREVLPSAAGIPPAQARSLFDQRLNEAMLQVDQGKPMPAARLSGPCASLYAALVPWDIRVLLQQTREPGARLNIHAQAAFDWIPWELLFDPELQAFLGLHFQISRLPIVTKPPVAATQPRVVRHIHNVLGKKVLDQAGDAALFDKWVTTFAQVDRKSVV